MLFLYGLSDKTKVIAHTDSAEYCMNCLHTSKHQIKKKSLYFTLFFLPVIPLHTKYYVTCPCCNYQRGIKRSEVKNITRESV